MPTAPGLLPPMTPTFDPYHRERSLLWRNRVAEWRAAPDEAAFHALALGLGGAIAAFGLWQSRATIAAGIDVLLARWPLLSTLLVVMVLSGLQRHALLAQRARWARHWLVAQPIADALRRRILLGQTLARALMQSLALMLLLGIAAADPQVLLMSPAIAAIAAALGWLGAMRGVRTIAAMPRRESVLAPMGRGSFRTWQWTEAAASLVPHRLSRLALLILLVPMGDWRLIWAALSLIVLGAAAVAWMRSLAVLPAAERWLAAEALPARSLLLRCAGQPLLLLALTVVVLLAILLKFGALAASWIVAPVLMVALLHAACTAAERRRPARIGIVMTVHLALLLGMLQAMPPLAAPLWMMQMFWLLREGLR